MSTRMSTSCPARSPSAYGHEPWLSGESCMSSGHATGISFLTLRAFSLPSSRASNAASTCMAHGVRAGIVTV